MLYQFQLNLDLFSLYGAETEVGPHFRMYGLAESWFLSFWVQLIFLQRHPKTTI